MPAKIKINILVDGVFHMQYINISETFWRLGLNLNLGFSLFKISGRAYANNAKPKFSGKKDSVEDKT